MLERLLLVLALVLVVAVAWGLVRLWRARLLRQLQAGAPPLAAVVPPGRPAVVAFSMPACVECRTRQQPALQRLAAAMGGSVTVRSLSALDCPDLVDRLGIITVPATAVVDSTGAIRHLNLGYASEQQLCEQLLSVAPHHLRQEPREALALEDPQGFSAVR